MYAGSSFLPLRRLTDNFFFSGVPDIELSELMQFVIGSPVIPVIGFDEHLQLAFVQYMVVSPTANVSQQLHNVIFCFAYQCIYLP